MANLNKYLAETRGRGAEIARRVGISPGTLSSIRSGRARPSPDLAKRIERATNGAVSAASLLGLEPDTAGPPRDLGDGRWVVYPDAEGRLILTPEMVAALGLPAGERLMFSSKTNGDTEVTSPMRALERIRRELKALEPSDRLWSEELIAERRAEAALEDMDD